MNNKCELCEVQASELAKCNGQRAIGNGQEATGITEFVSC